MNLSSQFNKLVAATVTGLGIACLMAPSAFAQTSPNSVPSSYQSDTLNTKQGDSGFNGTQNGNFDPMSLIHQANFGTLDWQNFSSQNNQQINSEVGSFRERQQKLLQQRLPQQQRNQDFAFPVYKPAQSPGN
ncbi:MAG: hypothetical protein WBA41_03435 [Rivularia sp. (in: cyanobacteria)]